MFKLDYIIIMVILVLALGSMTFINLFVLGGEDATTALISVDGKTIQEVDLSVNDHFYLQGTPSGGHVSVREGRISMTDCDCPDQICVNTSWVSRAGQIIVCIPNRIVIQVIGGEQPFDAITR